MNFRNKLAAGLAYWVQDGVGVSLCDPRWTEEQDANWAKRIHEAAQQVDREAAEQKETERIAAIERDRKEAELVKQKAYEQAHPKKAAEPTAQVYMCPDCKGAGSLYKQYFQYNKTKREYIGGAGSGSIIYRDTQTPVYSSRYIVCEKCKGTGYLKK